jgi:energy-coupling factor transporter ATP-binding protein EcfA2
MTIWLQLSRSELFFIHACALSIDNRCIVIAGASGSGKSTLAWTLCQLGFNYLSDELAPIEPETMRVEPYPHALCMKTEPPGGAILPNSTLVTDATMHIPASELPMHPLEQPSRIGAFVFIESIKHDGALKVDSIGASEAAIRLYSNGLNQLAHSGDGLPTASRIAQRIPSFLFSEGSVEERVLAIQEVANKTFK